MEFSRKFFSILGSATILALTPFHSDLWAQAGALDPSWDGDGLATVSAGDGRGSIATSVLIQPDGQVVAAGMATTSDRGLDFLLARFNADGTLDETFGANGVVTTDFPAGEGRSADYISDLILQPDGKILAVGATAFSDDLPISQSPTNEADMNFAMARYLPDGSLDPGFGTGGRVVYDFSQIGALDEIQAVILDDRGRILVAGRTLIQRGGSENDFALARFHANGTLDRSFGTGGRVQLDLGNDDQAQDILRLEGDKILVVGSSENRGDSDFALARFFADGSLDGQFGNGGVVMTDFPGAQGMGSTLDHAYSVVLTPEGRILAAGSTFSSNPISGGIALARYLEDGALDPSFGDGGTLLVKSSPPLAGSIAGARDMVLTAEGKIALAGGAGTVTPPSQFPLMAARLMADGSRDSTFGQEGLVLLDLPIFAGGYDSLNAIALQTDGKLVGAGFAQTRRDGDDHVLALSVVRFLGDPVREGEIPEAVTTEQGRAPVRLSLSGGGCSLATQRSSSGTIFEDPFNFSLFAFLILIYFGQIFCRAPRGLPEGLGERVKNVPDPAGIEWDISKKIN